MLKTSGFIDLRIGHGAAGVGDDSVWPSFTDIMTVIVMIFMMALVIIMVRNFVLSSELLSNISAREAAVLANQELSQENVELESTLERTEAERSQLATFLTQERARTAALGETQLELEADLKTLIAARAALEQANLGLEATLQSTEAERSSLAEDLTQALERIAALDETQLELEADLEVLIAARTALEQANLGLEATLQTTETERSTLAESLTRSLASIAELGERERGLQSDKEGLLQSQAELEASLQSTEADRSTLATDLAQALERIAALTAARDELELVNAELEQARLETRQKIAQLVASEESLAEDITSLSGQLSTLELESQTQITSLIDERAALEDKLHTLSDQLEQMRRLLTRSEHQNVLLTEEIAQVERISESTAERYARVTNEISELAGLIAQRETEIAALQIAANTSGRQYRSLQEEYEGLEEQYRKLVRPARNPAGKEVVEVRVQKTDGVLTYRVTQSSDDSSTVVDRSGLESILGDLKNEIGASLYTKIVIPDGSNLSFNEAWGITWEILQGYDYYYQ